MKEHPILFSTPMVRAILDGKKIRTRRLLERGGYKRSYSPFDGDFDDDGWPMACHIGSGCLTRITCPYGVVGDTLWVRESWAIDAPLDQVRREHEDALSGIGHGPYYRADKVHENTGLTWRPSIHMPRWASRITLENAAVHVERLQDISEEDAQAEGVERLHNGPRCYPGTGAARTRESARDAFKRLWDEINPKHPWESNPWVWVVSFKRLCEVPV